MRKKVLVLEDEDNIRGFVVINLRRGGYDTVEFSSGEEAFAYMREKNDVSVAILDVMLPDVTGFEICRRLRGIGYTGSSEAYIDDGRLYYLFLEGLDPTGYLPLDEYSFITEYGTQENAESLRLALQERGTCLCQTDAVDRLGVL